MREITLLLLLCIPIFAPAQKKGNKDFVLVIHGGAGSATRALLDKELEKNYRQAIDLALTKGYDILAKGGTAVDAVEAAINVLEDDSNFNAGKGAVMTAEGKNELDASIMNGKDLSAGAVAGVTIVKNPVTAAKVVMQKSPHVMMAGKGAEIFAASTGCTLVPASYFYTERQHRVLLKAKEEDSIQEVRTKKSLIKQPENYDGKYGTVGAVALDMHGNLAAATSTGGMTNKKYGRIGDSPVIGAGTYADDHTCAISCTGWGEYFIRLVLAKSVSDRMELKGISLQDAANEMIYGKLDAMGAQGGLIGLDKNGNITMPFNTSAMPRGYIRGNGEKEILIFKD